MKAPEGAFFFLLNGEIRSAWALTIHDAAKKRQRLAKRIGTRKKKAAPSADTKPEGPHPILRKWRKAEKPIEVIE
ncbi:MAG TPA: hypothetical protein VNT79_03835 [Phycisphaerae bacterium]|nr:hypothetical protein [Phycisphaerae bacterium]